MTILLGGVPISVVAWFRETHHETTSQGRWLDASTNLARIVTDNRLRPLYLINFTLYLAIFGFFRVYPMYLVDEFHLAVGRVIRAPSPRGARRDPRGGRPEPTSCCTRSLPESSTGSARQPRLRSCRGCEERCSSRRCSPPLRHSRAGCWCASRPTRTPMNLLTAITSCRS